MGSRRRTDGRVDGVQTERICASMNEGKRSMKTRHSQCLHISNSIDRDGHLAYVAWLLQFSMASDVLSLRQYHDRR